MLEKLKTLVLIEAHIKINTNNMNINRINGKGVGKHILVISGVHGNEITPIYSTYLLGKNNSELLLDKFSNIKILNAVNYSGILKNTREIANSYTDDLNRKFSNNKEEELEKILNEEIDKHDIIIDIHSSPDCCDFVLINQDLNANSYVEFCNKYNINYLTRYNSNNTIKKYCIEKGKICFTVELNKIDMIDFKSTERGAKLIENIINNIEDFEIKKEEPKYSTYEEFFHYNDGLFIPNPRKKLGDVVKKGDVIGDILNIKTFDKSEVIYNKPYKSRIICSSGLSYVSGNNSIYYIQPLK